MKDTIKSINEMVFPEREPLSDFEKKSQSLRGWESGQFVGIRETQCIGEVQTVNGDGTLTVVFESPDGDDWDVGKFHPEDLINLTRYE